MPGRKYELLEHDFVEFLDREHHHRLYRIRALRDFGHIKKGDLGGYIEREANLSHEGTAWVLPNAKVYENARVCDNALAYGDAELFGDACLSGSEQEGYARLDHTPVRRSPTLQKRSPPQQPPTP